MNHERSEVMPASWRTDLVGRLSSAWTLVVAAVLIGGSQVVFLSTERGWLLTADQQVRFIEAGGARVSDVQYAALLSQQVQQAWTSGAALAGVFIVGQLLVAGIVYAIGRVAGASRQIRQVLESTAPAALILGAGDIVLVTLRYASSDLGATMSVDVFVRPWLSTTGFVPHLLSQLDMFGLCWASVLGGNIASLHGLRTRATVSWTVGVYVGWACIKAGIKALVGASV